MKACCVKKYRKDIIGLLVGLTIIISSSNSSFGQTKKAPDTSGNLIPYVDCILIKANISTQTDDYFYKVLTEPGLTLRANNEYKTFLSLDYQFIGFSYGFSPKFLSGNNDINLKGKSSFTNFKFFVFVGKWFQTLEYYKTKGYYVENTGDFLSNWISGRDPYIQIPTMKNSGFNFATSYVFNKKYSIKNLLYQTEWQKHSSGSFIPSLFYDVNRNYFDYGGAQSIQRDYNIRIAGGYYYTFIIRKHFFIAPSLVSSFGGKFSKQTFIENGQQSTEHRSYLIQQTDAGLKLGFSSDRFVAGGGCNFSTNWYNEDDNNSVQNDKFFGVLYFGYRFGTPKILKKGYDYFSDKTGL